MGKILITTKVLFLAVILSFIVGCGGGGSSVTTINDSSPPEVISTFPYEGTALFAAHRVNDLVTLPGGSLWLFSGSSDASGHTRNAIQEFTIFLTTSSMLDPVVGIRSSHFMTLSGSSTSFYVSPVPYQEIIKQDLIRFSFNRTGDVITMSDNSLWLITGKSTGGTGSTRNENQELTIYFNTSDIPDPTDGYRTKYLMVVSGTATAFFVEPL